MCFCQNSSTVKNACKLIIRDSNKKFGPELYDNFNHSFYGQRMIPLQLSVMDDHEQWDGGNSLGGMSVKSGVLDNNLASITVAKIELGVVTYKLQPSSILE